MYSGIDLQLIKFELYFYFYEFFNVLGEVLVMCLYDRNFFNLEK